MSSIYHESTIGEDLDPEIEFAEPVGIAAPAPLVGQQGNYVYSDLEEADSGPYYFWSWGEIVALSDMYMGFPRIEPVTIQPIEDQKVWCDIRYLEGATGKQRASIDPETRRPQDFVEAQYTIHASANRATLVNSYGFNSKSTVGLIEITALSKKDPRRIGLAQFNQKLQPRRILFGRVPEDLVKEVETSGALSVRQRFVLEARDFFGSSEFLAQASVGLQRMYLGAIDEILQACDSYRRLANGYMALQDHALELPSDNAKSKDAYDDRDRELMWLLARPEIKVAQAKMIAAAGSGGLTGEQLQTILKANAATGLTPELIASIVAQAVSAAVLAVRSEQPAAPPATLSKKANRGGRRS